jgi:exodeoxyribonuclease-3
MDTTPRLRTEEPHATARRRFNEEFIGGLDLVDVFRDLHPQTHAYTWFNRRARSGRLDAARVDFVLASCTLADRVAGAGIDVAEAARAGSDHAPVWVEVRARG